MKRSRLIAALIALNILALASQADKLLNAAWADITSWSTTAASNTSAVGTEGMSENAAPSTVNDSYRAGLAQLAKLARQGVLASFGPATFSANAYYITPALVPASAISGQVFSFVAPSTNTGSATLRVGSITSKTIVKISNATLSSGDLQAGSLYTVVDDGTYYKLLNAPVGDLGTLNTISTSSYIDAGAITVSDIATAISGSMLFWNSSGNAAVFPRCTNGQAIVFTAGVPACGSPLPVPQIVLKTDTAETTSTSFLNITGLSVAITPTTSSKRVRVRAVIQGNLPTATGAMFFRFTRDGSTLGVGDSAGSRIQACGSIRSPGADSPDGTMVCEAQDNPATTSSVTYRVQVMVTAGTGYINRSGTDTDGVSHGRFSSFMSAVEEDAP